ncbi:MAG: hypothetical protein SFY96_06400 [Planctomycetota bacterium]|nr:hypothetical protein [Planctomycetota bacterium]
MSIIRFSCDRDDLIVPRDDGLWVDTTYDASTQTGRLGRFPQVDGFDAVSNQALALRAHLDRVIATHAASLTARKPVVVMVHGFLFNPYDAALLDRKESDNPHVRVYHFAPPDDPKEETERHNSAWCHGLGFAPDDAGAEGLAIGFGWYSSPGLASSMLKGGQNFYARAYDYGTEVAWTLLNLLHHLRAALNAAGHDNDIDLFCHSLGSHVVLQSVIQACIENRRIAMANGAGAQEGPLVHMLRGLDRLVILGGAEYVREAQLFYEEINRDDLGLKNTESCIVYNVGCRENDVLDTLAENFGPRFFGNSQVIGHNGLNHSDPYKMWMDLQIDSADLAKWMKSKLGVEILGDGPGIADHWHYYTYRPNMEMYKGIFRDRAAWSLPALRKAKIPEGIRTTWWGN